MIALERFGAALARRVVAALVASHLVLAAGAPAAAGPWDEASAPLVPDGFRVGAFRIEEKITMAVAERVLGIDPRNTGRVELNSPGGSLEAAMMIARYIRENGLATHVGDRGTCASACLLVLQAGVERSAGEDAVLIVHEATNAVGHFSPFVTRAYVDSMVAYGASPLFAQEILPIVERVLPASQARDLGIVQRVTRVSGLAEPPPERIRLADEAGGLTMTPD